MRRRHETSSFLAEINITPLTDVILVLLIIFMIATPLITQNNIEVKLPEAASRDDITAPEPAYITITGEGMVYLDNKVLSNKELRQKINALLAKNRDLKVVVAADQVCRFKDVVRVIDTLKELKIKSLNIATKPPRE